MNKIQVGEVFGLFVSQTENKGRVARDYITLDDGGVCEDKFYGKDIERSVLLVSKDSYKLAKENGIEVEFGKIGENILMDYNPYHLEIGTQLQIGETILEISQACTLCKSLSKVNNKLPKLLKNDRGIFAKVIKKGLVNSSDKIYLLS